MARKVGVLTIGQAPRIDVVPAMQTIWGHGVTVQEAGALDGLDAAAVAAVAPGPADSTLISRLRDGTPVRIAKPKILPLLQARIDALEAAGVDLTLLLCTGEFPAFRHARPLLEPDRILLHYVQGVSRGGHLGVVIPLPEQAGWARKKWGATGLQVSVASGSPYHGGSLAPPAGELAAAGCDLVVLDCMGFTPAQKAEVQANVRVPVILSNAAVARVITELL